MHIGAGWLGVAGHAGIIPRVPRRGICYRQRAGLCCQLSGDVDPSIDVVIDHPVVVVPEDVGWSFCTLQYGAL